MESDATDFLNASFRSLEISDSDEDLGCKPLSSPHGRKKRKQKELLTPQKPSKILDTKRTPKQALQAHSNPKQKFSQDKKMILEHFKEDSASVVSQEEIIEVLGFEFSEKKHITQCVKSCFPSVVISRPRRGGERTKLYKGMSKKNFVLASFSQQYGRSIDTVKKEIEVLEQEQNDIDSLMQIEIGNEDRTNLALLLSRQRIIQAKIRKLRDELTSIYEKTLEIISVKKTVRENKELFNEIQIFTSLTKLNLEGENEEVNKTKLVDELASLPNKLREKCPLIYNIVETLLLQNPNDKNVTQNEKKIKSTFHALAILQSMKSQKIQNDFKLMFTTLCVSYGAGDRFISMLNALGLTVSWKKFNKFLEERSVRKMSYVNKKTGDLNPIILLIDNINLYRGKRKHLRLMHNNGPKMWNFTGIGLIYPNISENVQQMLSDSNDCLKSQKDPLGLDPSEIFIEGDKEKLDIWENEKDIYLTNLLDCYLNRILPVTGTLGTIQQDRISTVLKNLQEKEPKIHNYKFSNKTNINKQSGKETTFEILPLSLEDNSTIAGTMNILDDFARNFNLPMTTKNEYCPFDKLKMNFDIKLARSHFELSLMQTKHQHFMSEFEEMIRNPSENDAQEDISNRLTTLENEQRRHRESDQYFYDNFDVVKNKLNDILSKGDKNEYKLFLLKAKSENFSNIKDHLRRTYLHISIEQGNEQLSRFLINSEFNVNEKEGCGLTPLSIAVLTKNLNLSKLLVNTGAKFNGPLFTSIPSPMDMALQLGYNDIIEIFEEEQSISEDENDTIRNLENCFRLNSTKNNTLDQIDNCNISRKTPNAITIVVGDVGTCKTNNAVMTRSGSYKWLGICPGDLHNKGYFCEAAFKAHGSSGFHYIAMHILERKTLSKEAFKGKKFNDNNLTKIREAVSDIAFGYGIAAAEEFKLSIEFPSNYEMSKAIKADKCHSKLLLRRFKKWINDNSDRDIAFQHSASLFNFYAPLLSFFDNATKFGDGVKREIVYQLLTPIYTQLAFPNYSTECFRHVVNILAKWPKVDRLLLQENCSVNLTGKIGCNIELDAFVESEIVKPFKKYVSMHTTVEMCEKIMANLSLFRSVRHSYKDKNTFDIHHTSKHKSPSSFPDQVKVAYFVIANDYFKNKGRIEIPCFPLTGKGKKNGHLPANLVNAYTKGKEKITENFEKKLFDSFSDLRYQILNCNNI